MQNESTLWNGGHVKTSCQDYTSNFLISTNNYINTRMFSLFYLGKKSNTISGIEYWSIYEHGRKLTRVKWSIAHSLHNRRVSKNQKFQCLVRFFFSNNFGFVNLDIIIFFFINYLLVVEVLFYSHFFNKIKMMHLFFKYRRPKAIYFFLFFAQKHRKLLDSSIFDRYREKKKRKRN